jgi:chromosome segregation ATPase
MKSAIAATEKTNAKMESERRLAESEIAVLQKHQGELQSQVSVATQKYNELIEIGQSHLSFELPLIQSVDSRIPGIRTQIAKLQSVKIPKPLITSSALEIEVTEWKQRLSERRKQFDDRTASIAIYTKLLAAKSKYHQLNVQMKGINAEIDKEQSERIREQELRENLAQLKENWKRELNSQESKLRSIYEKKKRTRDELLKEKSTLQSEIEAQYSSYERGREAAHSHVAEHKETIDRQQSEIEDLQRNRDLLRSLLRFDSECQTEKEPIPPDRLDKPREMPVGPAPRISNARAKLDDLWQRAQDTARETKGPP